MNPNEVRVYVCGLTYTVTMDGKRPVRVVVHFTGRSPNVNASALHQRTRPIWTAAMPLPTAGKAKQAIDAAIKGRGGFHG